MARRPKIVLKDEHKYFLVQRLAVFYSPPKEAADALKAEFAIEISPQRAEAYGPHKRAGEPLGQRWRDLFESTRERYLASLEEVPATHKRVRVERLDRMSQTAERRGNFPLDFKNRPKVVALQTDGTFAGSTSVFKDNFHWGPSDPS
jgi:hypothetical protein